MKKFLIVGLGNCGLEYEKTRHNIGFIIVEALSEQLEGTFSSSRLGDLARVKYKGRELILLKPNTFINLSGKSVLYWMQQEKIPLNHLLVVTDDLNLPFGTIRIKSKGSDGGHNGLKDIQARLETTEYARFRFGIGDEFSKGQQIDYVLGNWGAEESEKLKERLKQSAEAIKTFVFNGLEKAMNSFNNT